MTFKLSQRSMDNLFGVQPALVMVVQRAIQITRVDFGVIEGLRTEARTGREGRVADNEQSAPHRPRCRSDGLHRRARVVGTQPVR